MSGHSKWATTKYRKGAQDKARAKVFAKLIRQVEVASREGGGDLEANASLRTAYQKARSSSVPLDTIEKAIKRGTGELEGVRYEAINYEGYGPAGVAIIVETLSDNRNRTGSEIRNLFKTGQLGAPGCVAFFFNHLGVVEATHTDANRDAEGDAIETGAQEIEPLEAEETPEGHKGARFLTEIKDLDHVGKALKAAGWNIIAAEIRYVAKNFTEVTEAHRKEVTDFLNTLDDHDDVHRVYTALK